MRERKLFLVVAVVVILGGLLALGDACSTIAEAQAYRMQVHTSAAQHLQEQGYPAIEPEHLAQAYQKALLELTE